MTSQTRILLVEDEEADVVHFRRLCKRHGISAEIVVARDADEALEILLAQGSERGSLVVITDLNMPGLTGHEFIEEIRQHEATRATVVFVLSTSDLPEDIKMAYRHNIAGYIVKDARGERMDAGVKMLRHYMESVVLPV